MTPALLLLLPLLRRLLLQPPLFLLLLLPLRLRLLLRRWNPRPLRAPVGLGVRKSFRVVLGRS
jgi:hypothetical protein